MRVRNERIEVCSYDAWLSGRGCGCESVGSEAVRVAEVRL